MCPRLPGPYVGLKKTIRRRLDFAETNSYVRLVNTILYLLNTMRLKALLPIYIHDSNTGMGVQIELCLMSSEYRYKAQIRH